jgi:hypothetical protein
MSAPVEAISFSDKPDLKAKVKFWIFHEENEIRKKVILSKLDANYAKKFNDLIADKTMTVLQEDPANIIFQEADRLPKGYYTLYEGEFGPVHEYIFGKYVDDGQVIKQVSPPHPRTWVTGIPGTMGSKSYYEQDEERACEVMRPRFSELIKTTWEKIRVMR